MISELHCLEQFRVGFDWGKHLKAPSRLKKLSAEEQSQVILDYECCKGRVVGSTTFTEVPKSTPGKWRMIFNLPSPGKKSVNDGIRVPQCSLSYVNAIQRLEAMGRGFKVDMQRRFPYIQWTTICWEWFGIAKSLQMLHCHLGYDLPQEYF